MKKILFIKMVVFGVAAVFIAIGISQNGHIDVMNKAIRICFECIGIG